jgi:hypothetical protein
MARHRQAPAGPANGWRRDNETRKGYPVYIGVRAKQKAQKLAVVR